jgi:hypothetical protein
MSLSLSFASGESTLIHSDYYRAQKHSRIAFCLWVLKQLGNSYYAHNLIVNRLGPDIIGQLLGLDGLSVLCPRWWAAYKPPIGLLCPISLENISSSWTPMRRRNLVSWACLTVPSCGSRSIHATLSTHRVPWRAGAQCKFWLINNKFKKILRNEILDAHNTMMYDMDWATAGCMCSGSSSSDDYDVHVRQKIYNHKHPICRWCEDRVEDCRNKLCNTCYETQDGVEHQRTGCLCRNTCKMMVILRCDDDE